MKITANNFFIFPALIWISFNVMWLYFKYSEMNKRLIRIENELILNGIMPSELISKPLSDKDIHHS